MEAVQFTLKGSILDYVNISIPTISDARQVLIKVAFSGVCGTDLHIIEGAFPCNDKKAFTLGHESSGTVVEVGSAVKNVVKGDKVAINPNNGCNRCNFCQLGSYNYCKDGGLNTTLGIVRDGGWAQYVVATDDLVYKIPDSMTLELAALTEPISCLTRGWDLINPVSVGQKILVIGAGIIGNLFSAMLHLQGHKNVTVSEPVTKRRQLLELNTGFEVITPAVLTERQNKDSEYLFDVVMDCSGHPPAIEQGFALLKSGGKLCLFGVPHPDAKISIKPFDVIIKEIRIVGVNINPFTFSKALGLIESMGDRYLNYGKLGVKTFPLKSYKEALEQLRNGTITKAMFKMQ